MAQIPGTNVSAMVVPFDTQDIYATHNDKYGRGGFRVCDTLADRDSITSPRRKEGMWVKCLQDGKVYELNADLLTWKEVSFSGGSGSYTLPPATYSTLGGVKVGAGLSITPAGLLSVDASGSQGTSKDTINAGQTNAVDLFNLDYILAVRWCITIYDTVTKYVRTFEVSANQAGDGSISYAVTAIFGDPLDITVYAASTGSHLALFVQNDSANTVISTTTRLTVHPKELPQANSNPVTKDTIPAAGFLYADTININENRAVKWMVTLTNQITAQIRTLDVVAHHSYGFVAGEGTANFTVNAIFGNYSDYSCDVVVDQGQLALVIRNTGADLLNVTTSRVTIHPV